MVVKCTSTASASRTSPLTRHFEIPRGRSRLYDALHDPRSRRLLLPTDTGNGGFTTRISRRRRRRKISWPAQRNSGMGATDLRMARAVAGLQGLVSGDAGRQRGFLCPYQENARRWYKFSQERVPFINHAIIHPPVDRDRPPNEVADVCFHVEKETDEGLIISRRQGRRDGFGPHQLYLHRSSRADPVQDKNFAMVFIMPTNAPA